MWRFVVAAMAFGLALAACSSDPPSTDEYQELEGKLAAVTAERDLLLAEKAMADERLDKTSATIDAVGEIVSDPTAFGTEDEVLELLSQHFAPGATTHDLAYGEIDTIDGWRNTLFGGQVDAVTTEWHNWVCEDGSQGGSLWTWEGTNFVGEPFELIGISIAGYNDEGLGTGNTVMWPYPDEYVWEEFGIGP
jgi:hypothetical protein